MDGWKPTNIIYLVQLFSRDRIIALVTRISQQISQQWLRRSQLKFAQRFIEDLSSWLWWSSVFSTIFSLTFMILREMSQEQMNSSLHFEKDFFLLLHYQQVNVLIHPTQWFMTQYGKNYSHYHQSDLYFVFATVWHANMANSISFIAFKLTNLRLQAHNLV